MNTSRRILVTSALPYANGPIHLGHLVEYLQTDIWVRFQKLRNHECYYVCADDAHGSAIMLRAEKEKIDAQALIDQTHSEHLRDFQGFLIDFDCYHSTHSPENKALSESIYLALKKAGLMIRKTIQQPYDESKNMFLPDRYIKGECPKCHAKDQYGDNCEVCGTTYHAMDLINAYSVLSGKKPVLKETEHLFFDLPQLEDFLKNWLQHANIQDSIRNKISEWFEQGLQAWDITRDAPYWGFQIPEEKDKYFYVWLDAPVGYFASLQALCKKNHLCFDDFIRPDSEVEMHHFIGKDIAYFHLLFWPAMLHGAQWRLPTSVACHGFLTVNGEKMSKSRGTYIKAETYLKHLPPEALRYYFASKLNHRVEDIDLNLEDFRQKINSDLVGKLVNLASRAAPFLQKHFHNQLLQVEHPLLDDFAAKSETIAAHYEKREFSQVIREVMQLVDAANAYFDAEKPWQKIKNEDEKTQVQVIASITLNAFFRAAAYLQAILPHLMLAAQEFLQLEGKVDWLSINQTLGARRIRDFQAMMHRIEEKSIQNLIADSLEDLQEDKKDNKDKNMSAEIKIDDFAKMDIRIAKVLHCEAVEGSDKLLSFKLDVGELGERHVFSGIKAYHSPESLIGKYVVYLANLAPRKMRFGISEGMILSASHAEHLQVLLMEHGVQAGMKIS